VTLAHYPTGWLAHEVAFCPWSVRLLTVRLLLLLLRNHRVGFDQTWSECFPISVVGPNINWG